MRELRAIEPPNCPGTSEILAIGEEACRILEEADIPFVVGGAVATWAYGRLRCTKDLDLFIPDRMPERAMNILATRGFHTRDMDASWLYKAIKDDVVIDLIVWTTGNIRMDHDAFRRSRVVQVGRHTFKVMGPEDLLFRKILSFREESSKDWFDALSIVQQPPEDFDWDYFMRRITGKHARRCLAFFVFVQGELGDEAVPPGIIERLYQRCVAHPCEPDASVGSITFLPLFREEAWDIAEEA